MMLAVYRIGVHVPTPGVDSDALQNFFNAANNTIFGMFNMFSGGALQRLSVFALGIMPYISASIILQLLKVVIPHLEAEAFTFFTRLLLPGNGRGEIWWWLDETTGAHTGLSFGTEIGSQLYQVAEDGKKTILINSRETLPASIWQQLKIRADITGIQVFLNDLPLMDYSSTTDIRGTGQQIALAGNQKTWKVFDDLAIYPLKDTTFNYQEVSLSSEIRNHSHNIQRNVNLTPAEETPLPSQRNFSPDQLSEVRDAQGHIHKYTVHGSRLLYDGLPYVPLSGSDGQYWILVERSVPLPVYNELWDWNALQRIRTLGLHQPEVARTQAPVRSALAVQALVVASPGARAAGTAAIAVPVPDHRPGSRGAWTADGARSAPGHDDPRGMARVGRGSAAGRQPPSPPGG